MVDAYGPETCAVLREEMARVVDPADVESLLKSTVLGTSKHNQAYKCCANARNSRTNGEYRDPRCRAEFTSTAAIFHKGLSLLTKQQWRCAISGILLRGREGEKWFRIFEPGCDRPPSRPRQWRGGSVFEQHQPRQGQDPRVATATRRGRRSRFGVGYNVS